MKAAEKRGDEWAQNILGRIKHEEDLVAVDATYHLFCQRKLYQAPVTGQKRGYRPATNVDEAMNFIYTYLEENSEECQFSLDELIDQIEGDHRPDVRTVKDRLFKKYGEDVVIAETARKKSIVCFKNLGFKIITDAWYQNKKTNPEEEKLRIVTAAADIILGDIRSQVYETTQYTPPDNFLVDVNDVIPASVLHFFETVILKTKRSAQDKWKKKCVALSHALISAVRPRSFFSSLLNGVSVYLYQKFGSKLLIDMLATLGFSSSYSETSLLEMSTILRPEKPQMMRGTFCQFTFDNADFNVNTLDGLGTFHAMGGIMIVTPFDSVKPDTNIARVSRCTSREVIKNAGYIELKIFKKTDESGLSSITVADIQSIHPLHDDILPSASDILWLYGKFSKTVDIPGWNGFMEEVTRDEHYDRSKVLCLPFINYPPTHYDTIFTALRVASEKCKLQDQKTCFVTFDQPLYIKVKDILASCDDPELNSVVVRLGGFHLLMSFMGSIGVIMGGSGLKELFTTIYAQNSVDKLMSGHAYSRAVRAHTLSYLALSALVLETIDFTEDEKALMENMLADLDRCVILTSLENEQFQVVTNKFREALRLIESRGPTAKLWVQYIRMVTLIKQFIEAERMGNWALHLATVQKMLPFFHAAGHFFYAKCAHLYLQDMFTLKDRMDPLEYDKFTTEGYFTIRRTIKFWSGIWSDMTIEQTLMRTMKTSGGLTRGRGITDSVLTRWTLGMVHLQNICHEVENYCCCSSSTSEQHVDMRSSRIARDNVDTDKLRAWYTQHPPFPQSDVIMSLSTGIVGREDVNCHLSEEIGRVGISRIVGSNFETVKFKRKDKVVTFASVTNTVKVGDKKCTVDPLTLFHRLCIAKQSDEQLKEFFTYELSPFPMSMFCEEGMRKGTKSSFYSAFTPFKSNNIDGGNSVVVVDGGHLLHKVVWQHNASFGSIATSYVTYLRKHYGSKIVVVFDGYPSDATQKSTKSSERIRRANLHSSPDIIFEEETIAQVHQEKFLANENNKMRLISLLKKAFEAANVQVQQAVEDADTLIVNTAISMSSQYDAVFVVGEDIDLLVLLTGLAPLQNNIYFRKCGRGKTPDVFYSATSFKYSFADIILFIHAFSGCDTTSALFGQGKNKFCSIIQKLPHLEELGRTFLDVDASAEQIAKAGETFLVELYGGNSTSQNVNDLRYQLFARGATKIRFNLARLPPSKDAARFHSLRCYHQVQTWLGGKTNPLEWGWVRSTIGLSPHKTERDPAPESLLKVISCTCKKGCSNACGCRKAGLKCSSLCTFCLGQSCENVPDVLFDNDTEDPDDPSPVDLLNEEVDIQEFEVEEAEDDVEWTEHEKTRPGSSKRKKF